MVDTTTIKISISTRDYLKSLKVHPRETYDEVLKRVKEMLKKEQQEV